MFLYGEIVGYVYTQRFLLDLPARFPWVPLPPSSYFPIPHLIVPFHLSIRPHDGAVFSPPPTRHQREHCQRENIDEKEGSDSGRDEVRFQCLSLYTI